MTSLLTSRRQVSTDGGYYVNLASLTNTIFTEAAVATYLGGGASPNANSNAGVVTWNSLVTGAIGTVFLKDMGKSLFSADYDGAPGQLVFRKVQLVNNTAGGVGGSSANAFWTGYILLASDYALQSGVGIAKVAKYGV